MNYERREEIIKELKEELYVVDREEDGLEIEGFFHDEALDLLLRAAQLTKRMLET